VTLDHPIFTRWPAQHPDRLQLFSAPTPNGVKVGIMLEETGLASSSASTAFFMCRRGSTAASRVRRCSAGWQ
jgi:hypothetical protein